MGQELIKASNKDKQIEIVSLTESKKYNKKINKLLVQQNSLEAFKKADLIIDFTTKMHYADTKNNLKNEKKNYNRNNRIHRKTRKVY